jgi:hypothetical protein
MLLVALQGGSTHLLAQVLGHRDPATQDFGCPGKVIGAD